MPLIGLCDTAISGHLGSVSAIGGIAIGSLMLNTVLWLMGFLRMGSTGLTAGMVGARNKDGCIRVLNLSLILATIAGLTVVAAQYPLGKLLLSIINPDESVRAEAVAYYNITVWGIPAQLLLMSLTGWIIGLQNTVVPMSIAIGVNLINMELSFTLAIVLNMGIRGIAYGTLISNWLAAIASGLIAIIWIRGKRLAEMTKPVAGERSENALEKQVVKISEFFKVNGDLFLRSAFLLAVSMSMTSFGAGMGELVLGINAVMMQFFLFFSYFMDGFAFAGEAIVGRFRGMGDANAIRNCVRDLLKWGTAMAIIFALVYMLGSQSITSLLTDLPAVREGVKNMGIWLIILPPITVMAFIFDGVFIGLADTRRMLLATLLGAVTFFAISCSSGRPTTDNNLLWIAFEAYLLVRGLWLGSNYFFSKRNFVNLHKKRSDVR